MGDFNSHHTIWRYRDIDENGEALALWADLCDLHLLFDAKDKGSFRSARWNRDYNPDLTFVSRDHLDQPLPATCTVLGNFPNSQHRPIVTDIGLKIPLANSMPVPRWNFGRADWDGFRVSLDTELAAANLEPIASNYGKFVELVIKAAKVNIPRGYRKEYVPGWNSDSEKLYHEYQESEDQSAGAALLHSLDRSRKEKWESAVGNMDFKRSSRKAWKVLHRLSGKQHPQKLSLKVNPDAIANRMVDVTRAKRDKMFTKRVKQALRTDRRSAPTGQHLSRPFSIGEVVDGIKLLKYGKAAGPDNIFNEFIRAMGPHHRWEPLAEFHINLDSDDDELFNEDNYIYCLCSRVCISESDVEVLQDSQSQEWEDESHVHFSLDTSYKVKCEKDEGASCYCSASHTDNYCSTDEHDPAQIHGNLSHALQPSDSGADLTYPDCHSDFTNHYKLEKMDQDFPQTEIDENYQSETSWDKFWAVNGERLIWASWIKKYSDYINPNYLDENNELSIDERNIPKQHSADAIFEKENDRFKKNVNEEESMRDRKFSYDSKVNPYKKKKSNQQVMEKNDKNNDGNKDEAWLPIRRMRSCSEHDRMLSPRTIAGTDSMTNVTKITLSSYDVTSSHVTSESSPTDDYSVSSSTSEDQSNDQTRIANIDDNQDQPLSEELDTEQYWQFLWKKHFGEQYAFHYANYIESQNMQDQDVPEIVEMIPEKKIEEKLLDVECENSEGNSQEMPSVIEVQAQVDKINLDDNKVNKTRKKNKNANSRYIGSVGVLLQSLLKEEQKKSESNKNEVVDTAEGNNKSQSEPVNLESDIVDGPLELPNAQQNSSFNAYNSNDDGNDPPEEKAVSLKRSHEIDDEEEDSSEIIKDTFETMGFCVNSSRMPKGQLVYKKRVARLRPPRNKRFGIPRKTYFDDDGNPHEIDQAQESHDEREMQTDDDCPAVKSDNEKEPKDFDVPNGVLEQEADVAAIAASVALPPDPDDQEDEQIKNTQDAVVDTSVANSESTKRRRRQKRHAKADDVTDMPIELQGEPKMMNVTPENVAWHIADKCRYDVVLDAFCGAGGNTIQFAKTCKKVIAIDIDPAKVALARQNAAVYGVSDRIEFVVGDFFELAPTLSADMNVEYDLETMLEPRPASELMEAARTINNNIALYLPRNSRTDQFYNAILEQFITSWYSKITLQPFFVDELRHQLRYASACLLRRAVKINYSRFITERLIPCALRHYTLCADLPDAAPLLASKLAVHPAAANRNAELKYLRSVTNAIMPYLLKNGELQNSPQQTRITAAALKSALRSSTLDGQILDVFTNAEETDDSVENINILKYLDSIAAEDVQEQDLSTDNSPNETLRYKYEDFLQRVLQKSLLQTSELLHLFLTVDGDFSHVVQASTLNANSSDLGNIYQSGCATCGSSNCPRHDPVVSTEPWVGLQIHKQLDQAIEDINYSRFITERLIPCALRHYTLCADLPDAAPLLASKLAVHPAAANRNAELKYLRSVTNAIMPYLLKNGELQNSPQQTRITAAALKSALRSSTLDGQILDVFTNAEETDDSVENINILKYLDSIAAEDVQEQDLSTDNSPNETLRYKYEDFLQRVLQKSLLQTSELLHLFLTVDGDFSHVVQASTLNANSSDLGNIYQSESPHQRAQARAQLLGAAGGAALAAGAGLPAALDACFQLIQRPQLNKQCFTRTNENNEPT
ncbi:hypothetical protein MSG28_005355 [Choristoneura fumiferana]|uniref:Uncharacterized protein n=1 Tax=Choristoneura fumiferana TaxID=7141 RepID=A0ACC0JRM3_CHOFU|nr:hypothetical protein MSG28_005355 [Choristoneura fumiferana]